MVNLEIALKLAEYSQIAYLGYTDFEKMFEQKNQYIQYFERHDSQAIIDIVDANMIIAFRGTEPTHLIDWARDLNITKIRGAHGCVSIGVLDAYREIKTEIEQYIKEQAGRWRIYLTGHSLGGALATICASRLMEMGIEWEGLHTFGSPRVGDEKFADSLNIYQDKIFRWVNGCDIVTRLPMRVQGFKHCGTVQYIDGDGNIVEDGLSGWRDFKDKLNIRLDALNDKCFLKGIDDHSLEGYRQAIEAAISG